MLLDDGQLDRAALGRVVFQDADKRQALEQIVHPAVEAARVSAIALARAQGARVVICDIPLLFEVRLAWHFPRIVLVDAPPAVRVARMVRDRGLSEADAMARAAAQMPSSLKRCRADIVLDNGSDRAALDAALETAWRRLDAWAAVADALRAV
jgi:dephospho-CoA kinase